MKAVKQHQTYDASLLKKANAKGDLQTMALTPRPPTWFNQFLVGRTVWLQAESDSQLDFFRKKLFAIGVKDLTTDLRQPPGRDFSRAGIGTFAEGNAHGCCSWGHSVGRHLRRCRQDLVILFCFVFSECQAVSGFEEQANLVTFFPPKTSRSFPNFTMGL